MSTEFKEYSGNCHCGDFKFTIKLPELKQVKTCNCSICSRNGYLWIFPASGDQFTVKKGEGRLKNYTFGKKSMEHKFCPRCGTSVMGLLKNAPPGMANRADGSTLAINARALQDIDPNTLEIASVFDGASLLEPVYQPPTEFPALDPSVGEGLETYHGACHCGAVCYTVKTKSLADAEVRSCNCSICSRNGYLWIYPSKSCVAVKGGENLTGYEFASKRVSHKFCSTCGVSALSILKDPERDMAPVNVRTLIGVDLKALNIKPFDGGKEFGPAYVVPGDD